MANTKKFETAILASSLIGAALLAIAGLGFTAPAGEMSKLAYEGNLWCVNNYIEEEDAQGNKVTLPDPDGRNKMDPRYKGKEDWFRREQVTAETKEEAEQKATIQGLFEKSDKIELRAALDKGDEQFVTHHFNTGATHPGPCVGTGGSPQGLWINDAIRKECFDVEPPTDIPIDEVSASDSAPSLTDPNSLGQSASGTCTSLTNPNAVSEKKIYDFLKKYNSPMANSTAAIMATAKKHSISPAMLVGIAFQESSLGKAGRGARNRNPGNIKASSAMMANAGIKVAGHDSQRHTIFRSWDDGISGLGYVLNRTYFSRGRDTLPEIAQIYLTGNKQGWIDAVSTIIKRVCK